MQKENELEQRLRYSEQKRTHLRTLLAQHVSGEDTFVWSIVDLMTLLLIFFIFIYSQYAGPLSSNPMVHVRAPERTAGLQHQSIPPGQVPMKQGVVNTSREILNTLKLDFPRKPKTAAATSHSKTSDLAKATDPGEPMEQLKREAIAAVEENDRKAFSLRWNEQRLVFVLGEKVTFPAGQAKLLSGSQPILKKISHLIASKKDFTVLVSGHTDDTPIDTYQFPSNWELSAARAISVAKFLCRNGVDPRRLSIQGYAQYKPIHPNSTPENKQANRRVEITLIKQNPRESEENSYTPKG